MKLEEIAKQFALDGDAITTLASYGNGHINGTYLLVMDGSIRYIFQRINNKVFPDVEGLMENIVNVTSFLKGIIAKEGGEPERESLTVVPTKDGRSYFHDSDDDGYYRVYTFVEGSLTRERAENAAEFGESGYAFASFAKRLAGFEVSKLHDVIPNFHHSQKRFEHFLATLAADPMGRAKGVKDDIDFVLAHKADTEIVVRLIEEGKMPLRVTHNDTKLNNILFDEKTKKPLCIIDLDTIMPGSILYDFGDSIRFGCNPCAEDEKDLSKVNFDMEYYKAYVDGYVGALKSEMTETEIEYLAFGAKLMTLECGIRFLDDYLDGDHYFRTHYEGQNLDRFHTQRKLVEDMEKVMDEMNEYVKNVAKA